MDRREIYNSGQQKKVYKMNCVQCEIKAGRKVKEQWSK